jgi:predicted acetyltransferase
MAVEIRPATADEMPTLATVVGAALAMPASSFRDLAPEMTLCAFEDDRLATVHGSWPLTMRFNGKSVPISGVTTVASDPVDRGRGYLRRIITQHFAELHEQGERPLALLYASQAAIYQRFGYAIVSTHYRYEVEPQYLEFAEPLDVPGRLRPLDPEREFGTLVDLYRAFREDRTGLVHRGRPMWNAGVLAPPEGEHAKTIVVYEEAGQPQGYLIYTTGSDYHDRPLPGQKAVVNDLVWLNPRAYRAAWQLLAGMRLARFVAWNQAPSDDPLPHILLEPRMLRATAHDGLLARIVDLPASFRARRYPATETLRFEVADPLCPWNAGRWQVTTGDDDAEVTPLRQGDVDLSLSINTLAMLLFGQISATEAARTGRVAVHDPGALPRWDAALATMYAPFCSDSF